MVRETRLKHACFNGQQDNFAVATDDGLRLLNTHPTTLLRSLGGDLVGNVRLCSILHRSNIIVFVGGGIKYPPNTAIVWDDSKKEPVLEIAVTGGPILNVFITYTRLVIVQDKRIHVFAFPHPCKFIRTEETRFNPSGLSAASTDISSQILVYPGFKVGSVQILNLNNVSDHSSLAPCSVDAHVSELAQLAINAQGTLFASGSIKGTVIRVFDTRTLACMLECRRGADPATLHSMQFSPCSSFLAVSSDKGTVHIFTIRDSDNSSTKRGTILQQVGLSKGERRSCSQISLEPRVLSCGFTLGKEDAFQSLVCVCEDGTFHRFYFSPDGVSHREGFDYIMQLADEQEFWTKPF